MKKHLVILFLICFSFSILNAQQKTAGEYLQIKWNAYQRYSKTFSSIDAYYAGLYEGYLDACFTMFLRAGYPIPENVTNEQIYAIVGKFVENHPEKWNMTTIELVVTAVQTAFPEKKK